MKNISKYILHVNLGKSSETSSGKRRPFNNKKNLGGRIDKPSVCHIQCMPIRFLPYQWSQLVTAWWCLIVPIMGWDLTHVTVLRLAALCCLNKLLLKPVGSKEKPAVPWKPYPVLTKRYCSTSAATAGSSFFVFAITTSWLWLLPLSPQIANFALAILCSADNNSDLSVSRRICKKSDLKSRQRGCFQSSRQTIWKKLNIQTQRHACYLRMSVQYW